MTKSCFNCANKEEIYDNGEEKVVVCEINRYIENIYPREAEATASRCIAYKEESLTNEEWFCQLSTEEKVKALLNLHEKVRQRMRTDIGGENSFYKGEYYREWLKENHDEM